MITFFNFIGVMFIILLIIAIIFMKKELNSYIHRIDGFDKSSLNRDINYTILGLCICAGIIGGILSLIIFV
jgi:hypothetical protein